MRCLCHSQQMDRALRRFLPVCHMLGFVLLCLVCVNAPASSEQFSTSPEPYHVGVWFYPSWNLYCLGYVGASALDRDVRASGYLGWRPRLRRK